MDRNVVGMAFDSDIEAVLVQGIRNPRQFADRVGKEMGFAAAEKAQFLQADDEADRGQPLFDLMVLDFTTERVFQLASRLLDVDSRSMLCFRQSGATCDPVQLLRRDSMFELRALSPGIASNCWKAP